MQLLCSFSGAGAQRQRGREGKDAAPAQVFKWTECEKNKPIGLWRLSHCEILIIQRGIMKREEREERERERDRQKHTDQLMGEKKVTGLQKVTTAPLLLGELIVVENDVI